MLLFNLVQLQNGATASSTAVLRINTANCYSCYELLPTATVICYDYIVQLFAWATFKLSCSYTSCAGIYCPLLGIGPLLLWRAYCQVRKLKTFFIDFPSSLMSCLVIVSPHNTQTLSVGCNEGCGVFGESWQLAESLRVRPARAWSTCVRRGWKYHDCKRLCMCCKKCTVLCVISVYVV